MTHQLAVGKPPQQKYPSLGGFTGVKMIAPCTGIAAFIAGRKGSGKSTLMQTCPDAFIFNLDGSSTVADTIEATIWPGIDPDTGQLLDAPGKPIHMTWDLCLSKINALKEASKKNLPRPKIVVFDTVTAWSTLLEEYIPRNASRLIGGADKSSWNELDGRQAWSTMYSIITSAIMELRQHGYGVYVMGHIVDNVIPLGEDKNKVEPQLAINKGLYKNIMWVFEMVGVMSKMSKAKFVDRTLSIGGTKKESIAYVEHTITVRDSGTYSEIVHKRVPTLDNVVVDATNGWSTFETAYNEARKAEENKE